MTEEKPGEKDKKPTQKKIGFKYDKNLIAKGLFSKGKIEAYLKNSDKSSIS
jgi:hypothetical protein